MNFTKDIIAGLDTELIEKLQKLMEEGYIDDPASVANEILADGIATFINEFDRETPKYPISKKNSPR